MKNKLKKHQRQSRRRKIACYCRVSTDRQAEEGFGLDVQHEKLETYLKLVERYNEDDVLWFIDDGYSAKNMNRPKMNELISMIELGLISEVCVARLDRLTRDVSNLYDFFTLLQEYNTSLFCLIGDSDINTAGGRLNLGIQTMVAQWERETNSERVKETNQEIARQGLYPYGQPPFGYKINKEKKVLEINEEQADAIRYIYNTAIQLHSLKDTVSVLNHEGILGRKWNYNYVSNLINNPAIRGHLINSNVHELNHHAPIITDEEYEIFKTAIHRNSDMLLPKHPFLFRYLVYCDECGARCRQTFTTKKKIGKTYKYYRCDTCKKSISEEVLEWGVMYHTSMDYNELSFKKQIQKLNKRYVSLMNKSENLTQLVKYEAIPLAKINEMYNTIEKEKNKILIEMDKYMKISTLKYSELTANEKEVMYARLYSQIVVDFLNKDVVELKKNTIQE